MKINKSYLTLILVFSMIQFGSHTAPVQAQGVTLTVLVSDQQIPIIQQRVAAFVAANAGIDGVTLVDSGSRSDDQFDYLTTTFTAGSADFDIVSMDVIHPAAFAGNGWLADLSDIWPQSERDLYIDGHVDAMIYDGDVIASPFFMDSGLVLYRADILQRNGFTIADFETWTDFQTNLNAILDNSTEASLNPNLEGYVFQGDAYEGGVVNLVEWMGASGGSFLNAAGTAANFAASAVPAMTYWKGLIADRYTGVLDNPGTDAVAQRSELIGDEGSAVTKWLAGNAVFQRNWPFSYASSLTDEFLNGTTVSADWGGGLRFGVTSLPYSEAECGVGNTAGCKSAVLGGAVLAIPASSPNIAEAKLLLQEIASFDAQFEMFTTQGNPATLKSIYTPTLLNSSNNLEWAIDFFNNVFPNVLPRPVHPDYQAMSAAIQPIFHDALGGVTPILTALEIMDEEVNIILGNFEESFQTTTIVTTIDGVETTLTSIITEESPGLRLIASLLALFTLAVTTPRILRRKKLT